MARGIPGVPRRFRWRGRAFEVAKVEDTWKELSASPPGGGDRYVRRHGFTVRTTDGEILKLVAARGSARVRWYLRSGSVENRRSSSEGDGEGRPTP